MGYVLSALVAVIIGLTVLLKISWSTNDTLKADKIEIQHKLDTTTADLKTSVDNAERMLSEKNRLLVIERERAKVEQSEAVEAAKIQKDIDYAEDGTACVDSDPMQRVLRGLWDRSGHTVDTDAPVPDAGRPGNATGMPSPARTAKP